MSAGLKTLAIVPLVLLVLLLAGRLLIHALHHRGVRLPIAWLRWSGFSFVLLRDGVLHHCTLREHRTLALAAVAKIEYAYHAVVGFVAVWIFTGRDGNELAIDASCPGTRRLLIDLERDLPGFSIAAWRQAFDAGDVEDTVQVWPATARVAAPPSSGLDAPATSTSGGASHDPV